MKCLVANVLVDAENPANTALGKKDDRFKGLDSSGNLGLGDQGDPKVTLVAEPCHHTPPITETLVH